MTSREQLQDTLCERLFWHTAERDDGKVADYLFHRHEMDVVYAMDEATLFDSFFNYLQDIEVFPLLERLDPKNQRRKNVPFSQILLVFLMKVVGSIKKMDQMTDLLLTDELLMNMCGFNAYQVKNGSCKRGEKLRKTFIPEFRGALCVDTVANHIVTISPRRIENLFNRCIQQVAKQGMFPKSIHAACDCTLYETTRKFKGCGSVTHKRKVKARGRRKSGELKEVKVTIYGWKVWAVYEIKTGIPLAIKIDTIIQVYMTMAMKALTTAFLKWQEDQLKLEALGKPSTWQMYRRKLKVLNRNKLIVFANEYFGIFPSHEVFMLANVPVRDTEKELNITRDQVYAKYTDGLLIEKS